MHTCYVHTYVHYTGQIHTVSTWIRMHTGRIFLYIACVLSVMRTDLLRMKFEASSMYMLNSFPWHLYPVKIKIDLIVSSHAMSKQLVAQ